MFVSDGLYNIKLQEILKMSFGIEAIEFYAPKTYVDQAEYGTSSLKQNNTPMSPKGNTRKDWDNFNFPLLLKPKT